MIHRRLSLCATLALVILVSQFVPFGNVVHVAAAACRNRAAFVTDVTVPDGSTFSPGAAFVKTWRLKNDGTCTWTSAYSLAYVSGDPLAATTSLTMPTTPPGQLVDFSFDMNAPTTPGHYRGYWMLKDSQGVKFGLGAKADRPFWVDINVSNIPTATPTPMTGLILQGTVTLNGAGLAGVRIYRSFASYGGVLVATTGADGKYKADFVFIPGDEMVTVWAELAGYTFDPAKSFWRHYHGLENTTIDFKATPSPTSPPPPDGATFDFVKEMCTATWKSGAGTLPCPGTEGDARGFALKVDSPRLENGAVDSAPGIVVFPQNKYNGYIQGFFPSYTVQPGDHFRATVGCAYGSSCYVTFRLDYEFSGISPKVFWSWQEKNEGKFYRVDKDLSALAGKTVKFTLTILASGTATGDRALWGQPRIVRAGSIPTTPPPTTPPATTPPPTTPAPTDTPVPQGNVTEAKASVKIPDYVNCASILSAELVGSITTNGPATVTYHWEISGVNNYTTSESTLEFASAGTQPANVNVSLGCSSYVAKLVVTSPNAISGQTEFTLSIPTVLPIYDFNTFKVIGTLSCGEFVKYTWRQEACNGESGGCWISQTPLFENDYAGFLRHDGNTICGLNLP